MATLQVIWFVLVGVLLTGYALLDGFDLGVGFWYLFTRREQDKRVMLNAIGPFWDGNEVWLLTGGGALFAAFPDVYATVFSGFYLALFLVLLSLILRAVALEYRSKVDSPTWRTRWDWVFGLSSAIPALLFGVALGNVLRGLPLDASKTFTGNFFTLLNPFALLIGLTGMAMLLTHGALYLTLKAKGELQATAGSWAWRSWGAYLGLFVIGSGVTMATQPHLVANYQAFPVLFLLPLASLAAVGAIGYFVKKAKWGRAFVASSASIVGLMATSFAGLFPNVVPALGDPALSLTAWNASSSQLTLTVMLVLALLGMPLVIGYTIWAYKTFATMEPGEGEY